jgi:hypothetical protein
MPKIADRCARMGGGLSALAAAALFACSSPSSGAERHPDRNATTPDAGPGNVGTGGTRSTTAPSATVATPDPYGGSAGNWPTEIEIGAGGMKPCVDTATDPDNCGKCGNRCGFVKIVEGQRPSRLAVDSTNVYWTNSTANFSEWTLMKKPLQGGAPVALVSDRNMGDFAVGATSVYWTEVQGGKVMRVPISGGTPETIASNEPRPFKVAVDAQSIYWSTLSTADCPDGGLTCASGGTLKRAALDGSAPKTLASHIELPSSIVVDGTNVYWAAPGSNITNGSIYKVKLEGGTPQALASHVWSLHDAIAISATNIYWIQNGQTDGGGAETLFTMPIDGGTATPLAQVGGRPLSADAMNLYFLDGARIMKLPMTGGAPIPLTDYPSPAATEVVSDGANVYWTAYDTTAASDGVLYGSILAISPSTCRGGQCACPEGQTLCTGQCVDLKTNATNCGACSNACNAGVTCMNGQCG